MLVIDLFCVILTVKLTKLKSCGVQISFNPSSYIFFLLGKTWTVRNTGH